jgi:hypothetical protein
MNKNASNLTKERDRRHRRYVAEFAWPVGVPVTQLSADDCYAIIEAIDSYRARRRDATSGRPVALGVLREIVVDAMADATRPVVPGDLGYALQLDHTDLAHIATALSEAECSWASEWDLEEAAATLARVQSSPAYENSTAATGRTS